MLKQSILIALVFLIASCGQNEPSSIKTTDSTTFRSTISKQDTSVRPVDAVGIKVKPEAYNQEIKSLMPSLAQFVSKGYTTLDTTSGDLNLDQYPDMILVLKKNGEDTTSDVVEHPEKRPLLILLGQADKSYKLAAHNDMPSIVLTVVV